MFNVRRPNTNGARTFAGDSVGGEVTGRSGLREGGRPQEARIRIRDSTVAGAGIRSASRGKQDRFRRRRVAPDVGGRGRPGPQERKKRTARTTYWRQMGHSASCLEQRVQAAMCPHSSSTHSSGAAMQILQHSSSGRLSISAKHVIDDGVAIAERNLGAMVELVKL